MNATGKIHVAEVAHREAAEAARWWALLGDRDCISSAPFQLSACHFTLKLVITGQHSHGSKNYFDSPEPLNRRLKDVLKRHPEIIEEAIASLGEDARRARADAADELRRALAEMEPGS